MLPGQPWVWAWDSAVGSTALVKNHHSRLLLKPWQNACRRTEDTHNPFPPPQIRWPLLKQKISQGQAQKCKLLTDIEMLMIQYHKYARVEYHGRAKVSLKKKRVCPHCSFTSRLKSLTTKGNKLSTKGHCYEGLSGWCGSYFSEARLHSVNAEILSYRPEPIGSMAQG